MATFFRSKTISSHWFSLLLLLLSLLCVVNSWKTLINTYKVAVFEHTVIVARPDLDTREMAIEAMKRNLDVFNEAVFQARTKGVKLIVFPEYGIYDTFMTRERMSLFAEIVPDPRSIRRNPCKDPAFQSQSTEILKTLSCMARDSDMFIVVNMAAREICSREFGCPSDGQFLYNANVVFSSNGEIVARYYKTHLFWEEAWFNSSTSYEMAVFDTPFGKFGTFMCFDHEAVELIEQHSVRNIAYPAAWVNLPPIFQSVQTHSAFARMANINLLAASVHRLQTNSFGSGIYTPEGAKVSYFRPDINKSRLLVATIHRINAVRPESSAINYNIPYIPVEDENVQSIFGRGDFTFLKYRHLTDRSGMVKVCDKTLCCQVNYAVKDRFREIYGLGIYEGLLVAGENKLYFQICTLLKCPNGKCGKKIDRVKTIFKYIHLKGTGFLDRYVFPSFSTMGRNHLTLDPYVWHYSVEEGIETNPRTNIKLHSTSLVARIYAKDHKILTKKSNPGTENVVKMAVKYVLYMVAAYVYAAI